MILKIAFRNIFRQKRRSLLTALAMVGGFVLASISIGVAEGSYDQIIDGFTRVNLGHIQIHSKGYLDQPSLYNNIPNYNKIGEILSQYDEIFAWSYRVNSGGLAFVDEKTSGVMIMGINPEMENRATLFENRISEGKNLSPTAQKEVLIGKGLAKILKASLGDSLIVVSQGADGSIANDIYIIEGIITTQNDALDRIALYMHIHDAQELLVLGSKIHEVVIVLNDIEKAIDFSNTLNQELNPLNKKGLEVILEDVNNIQGFSTKEFASSFYNTYHSKDLTAFEIDDSLEKLQQLFSSKTKDSQINSRISDTLQYYIERPKLEVEPWQEFAKSFYQAMQADKQGNYYVQFIIMVIVAVGVLNTVLMSVLERTREYGLLKAIGTKPRQIFLLIVTETAMLSIFSIIAGTIISFGLNQYLSQNGISLGTSFDVGGFSIDKFISQVSFIVFLIPGIIVLVSAVFVSIFPAIRASRTNPAKTMRMH